MAVLLDSGFLLASLNSSEAEHQATIGVLESIREPIVLPVPAITEVAYLLARDIGNDAAADFISSLADTELILEAPLAEDYLRSAEILRQYADANLDFVDALIAATAERLVKYPPSTMTRPFFVRGLVFLLLPVRRRQHLRPMGRESSLLWSLPHYLAVRRT